MAHKQLPIVWSLHLPQDKRKEFSQAVSVYLEDRVTKRFIEMLLDKKNSLETKFDYDTPNWPYRQAHANGYVEAIEDILTLITKEDK